MKHKSLIRIAKCLLAIILVCNGLGINKIIYAQTNNNISNVEFKSFKTVQDCIDYAKKNNINLKQNALSSKNADVDLKTAKASMFPNLSFGVNQNYSGNYNGNYGLSARLNLYNGGIISNTIKQKSISQEISVLNIKQYENTLEESIAEYYIQILYARESVKINEQTVDLSGQQLDRAKTLLEVGSISKSDYAQLDAQYSSNKYQLVSAQSTLSKYILNLKQLLELGANEELYIDDIQIEGDKVMEQIPSIESVYNVAYTIRPEIKIGELNINNSFLGLKIAKGAYLPQIQLNASSSSSNMSGTNYNFISQIKNAFTNNVGISISIPIYNNRSAKSGVEKANYELEISKLEIKNTQKTLYQKIENIFLDAKTSRENYISSIDKMKSADISYTLVNEQFNLGMKNIVELVQAKNTFLSSQQEMLQYKYMCIYSIAILNFYTGKEIKF